MPEANNLVQTERDRPAFHTWGSQIKRRTTETMWPPPDRGPHVPAHRVDKL